MNRMVTIAPVRKSVSVNAPPARAFEIFTVGMSRWWPSSHTILKVAPREHVIEPKAGGRWYSVGIDGSECDNGKVLSWEPPSRLVLVWQINAEWQYDPDLATEVEINFVAEGSGTRVSLEHRGLERMGSKGETMRSQVDSSGGWTAILEAFAAGARA